MPAAAPAPCCAHPDANTNQSLSYARCKRSTSQRSSIRRCQPSPVASRRAIAQLAASAEPMVDSAPVTIVSGGRRQSR